VAFGPRPAGSPALRQTRAYILAELKKLGIETREQSFVARTPLGEIAMTNVIGTIRGRRSERFALATHYDTKLFRDIRFVGASDAASSTAAVLELARILALRQNEFTIEFLFFDGEEAVIEWNRDDDNTYGSRHYVQTARQDGSIRGLLALALLDMIGDRDLIIRRDANSTPWLVDAVWAAAARLGHGSTFSNELTSIDDDHIPFLRAGIPAVDVIDLDYPAWHTAEDTLENVSARSLQIVGDVILAALPDIEQRLVRGR
jgi:Zn-dependent M28 family amino/carboxypeptidase